MILSFLNQLTYCILMANASKTHRSHFRNITNYIIVAIECYTHFITTIEDDELFHMLTYLYIVDKMQIPIQ